MTWARVNVDLPSNPKVRRVSQAARWTYVAGICYSVANLTDGELPKGALSLIDGTPKLAAELVASGLWEARREAWYIHDFLEYNRSRASVDKVKEERRIAGNKGNAKRWQIATQMESQKPPHMNVSVVVDVLPTTPSLEGDQESTTTTTGDVLANCDEDAMFRETLRHYERATGALVNASIGDGITDWLTRVPPDWLKDAITKTGEAQKRWNYTVGILRNWEENGRDDVNPTEPEGLEAQKQRYLGGDLGHLVANR